MKIRFSSLMLLFAVVIFTLFAGSAVADSQNEVEFSGIVKKVLPEKNKVAIQDQETKKRFTLVVEEKTKLEGFAGLGELNKKDKIKGKYIVTPKGLYVATQLKRQ